MLEERGVKGGVKSQDETIAVQITNYSGKPN